MLIPPSAHIVLDKQVSHEPMAALPHTAFIWFWPAHQCENLPRSVKSYADYLCVSPNHLSAVVQKESSLSVMSWLNAHCILKAKVTLLHTDKPMYTIAEKLGFQSATFFSIFFHRETGVTPSILRKR